MPRNWKEIFDVYNKLAKRKGKLILAAELLNGDIVRFANGRRIVDTLFLCNVGHDGEVFLSKADEDLLGRSVGVSFSKDKITDQMFSEFRRIASVGEYPQKVEC